MRSASSKRSKSKSSKSGSSSNKTENAEKYFHRELYRNSRIAYFKRTKKIGIYLKNRHINEKWNQWIDNEGDENNNTGKERPSRSKSSSSRKKTSRSSSEKRTEKSEPKKDVIERGFLEGLVLFKPSLLTEGRGLYLEISCTYKYYNDRKNAPFTENYFIEKVLFRKVRKLYPIAMLEVDDTNDEYFQLYISKLRRDNGETFDVIPFILDLSSLQDSIGFHKPNDRIQKCGTFWTARLYISTDPDKDYSCEDENVIMKFCKSTQVNLAHVKSPLSITRKLLPSRCETKTLEVKVNLERSHFSTEDEIPVKMEIKNGTSTYEVNGIEILIFQIKTYKNDQDYTVVGKHYLSNLNIKSTWTGSAEIKLFADRNVYDLAIEGILDDEKVVRLANSTYLMTEQIEESIELVKIEAKVDNENSPKKRSGSTDSKKIKSRSKSPKKNKKKSKSKESPKSENLEPESEQFMPLIVEKKSFRKKDIRNSRELRIEYEIVVKIGLRNVHDKDENTLFLANCLECKIPIFLSNFKRFFEEITPKSSSSSSKQSKSRSSSKKRSKSPKMA